MSENKHEKMWNDLKTEMESLESKSIKKLVFTKIKFIEKKYKKD